LKNLIIVKPSALAKKVLGLIIQRIEEKNAIIVSIKTSLFDIHSIEKKLIEEQEEKNKKELINAKKIPCVLIIIQGSDAINFGQNLKKEFNDYIHVSLNEETAKYEINRFFEKNEIFENEKNDGNYFLKKIDRKEILSKSIKEITREFNK
jgi:hypothetical protein